MKPILEIQNISKKYRIQHLAGGYLSLRERMTSALRFEKSSIEDFWALNDVSFEVQPGESIGVIGRNGAGKSTLLKILSKITPPTSGRIVSRGRIASLLEVGTGFHPELTGSENIFFNGSLLGMKRKEIESKFDEIVDFSGVEKFLDTPLKHFSSGMQLRLAFAVAAFLEPEILIIDEVLAVGDAEFQRKCLRKMGDVSKSGRTILFVSHNMAAVQNLCNKVIVLDSGSVKKICPAAEGIIHYHNLSQKTEIIKTASHKPTYVSDIKIDSDTVNVCTFQSTSFSTEVTSSIALNNVLIGFGINDIMGGRLFTLFSKFNDQRYRVHVGKNIFSVRIDSLPLKPGIYTMEVYVGDGATVYDYYDRGFTFEVVAPPTIHHHSLPDDSQGHFVLNQEWK